MRLAWKISISLLVAAALLALIVYLVGARATAAAAWQVGLPAFFVVGGTLFAVLACQAAAWAVLERRMGHRVAYRTLLAGAIVAIAGNILTPASHLGGEPGRILYAGRRTGIPYTELAGTVLLCKYLEALSFVLFLGFATAAAVVGFRQTLFHPPYVFLGAIIVALAAAALVLGAVLWIALARTWTPLSGIVALLARLMGKPGLARLSRPFAKNVSGPVSRAAPGPEKGGQAPFPKEDAETEPLSTPFFQRLHRRALRMESLASRLFREEGNAVIPAFLWYLLAHAALFVRPAVFFWLAWHIDLDLAEMGLIFLASQLTLAVQLLPSGAGTLDGGLLLVAPVMGISGPQCAAFLLCVRFWDAAVVAAGALLAAHAGVGLFRGNGQKS